MNALFSKTTMELTGDLFLRRSMGFDAKDIPDTIRVIKASVDKTYKSNDEDIEDLFDVIGIINDYVCYTFKECKHPADLHDLVRIRVYAKKTATQKLRDIKLDKRRFWNWEQADQQYIEGIQYVWKPGMRAMAALLSDCDPASVYEERDPVLNTDVMDRISKPRMNVLID